MWAATWKFMDNVEYSKFIKTVRQANMNINICICTYIYLEHHFMQGFDNFF